MSVAAGSAHTDIHDDAFEANTIEENKENCVKEEDEPTREGGWDWMVVLSCAVQHFIAFGYRLSFGLIFIELRDEFQASNSATAWIQSINHVSYLGSAPIVAAMLKVIPARYVVILGSVISAVGLVISTFVRSMEILYLTLGVINGIGVGLLAATGIVLPSHFFSRRRALATGVAMSGGSIGTFVMAPLMTALIEMYGWRGASYILAGIALQGCVFGAYLWEPVLAPPPNINGNGKKSSVTKNCDIDSQSSDQLESKQNDEAKIHSETPEEEPGSIKGRIKAFWDTAKIFMSGLFDLKLLRIPVLVGMMLAKGFAGIGVVTSYLFIPDRAISYGLKPEEASFMVSVAGVMSLVGRIILGFVSDRPSLRHRRAYVVAICFLVCSIASILSFQRSLTAQIIYSAVFGFTTGGVVSMLPVVCGDTAGVEKLATAYGMANTVSIFFSITGPTVGGTIYDATRNYMYVFGYLGGVMGLGFLSTVLPQAVKDVCRHRKQRSDPDQSETAVTKL